MNFWNAWMIGRFWWWWGGAAVVTAGVLCMFLSLCLRGVVTTDNIIPWSAILVALVGIVSGSAWLRSTLHRHLAALPLLLLLVPLVVCVGGALLFSAFYILLFIFGKGRIN